MRALLWRGTNFEKDLMTKEGQWRQGWMLVGASRYEQHERTEQKQ